MPLNFDTLFNEMVGAAKQSLGDHWVGIEGIAVTSFKTLTSNIIEIERVRISGTITPEKASFLVGMQKDSVKIAIATEKGLSLLAAEAALNAAIDVVRDTVNRAVGFAIL